MYDAIYGNMYRETLWELNMEYMPKTPSVRGAASSALVMPKGIAEGSNCLRAGKVIKKHFCC